MKKAAVLILAVSVFFSSLVIPIQKADAFLAPLGRIVLGSTGEKILIGMAERGGIKMGTRQAQKDMTNWVNKAAIHDKNPDAINLVKAVNSAKPVYEKSKLQKYVLDPMMWLTGVDLLVGAAALLMGGKEEVLDDTKTTNREIPATNASCRQKPLTDKEKESAANGQQYYKVWSIWWNEYDTNTTGAWYPSGRVGGSDCSITSVMYQYRSGNHYAEITAHVTGDAYVFSDKPASSINHTASVRLTNDQVGPSYGMSISGISPGQITFDSNPYIEERRKDRDPGKMPKAIEINVDTTEVDTGVTGKPLYYDYPVPNLPITSINDGQTDKDKDWIIIINPDGTSPTVPDRDYGDLTPVDDPLDTPKNFFIVMQEMGKKVTDMYNGVTSFMQNSVKMMSSLVTGTAGMVTFLGTFFNWLPKEFTTLLQVALMLGVVSFFLRR